MAAKAQHAQGNSVIERRLRPIYDWLEQGNNKKALQESEKVVKKWPSVTCGRALRCLALLRLGRESEAHSLLEALVAGTPTEDATLQVITMCYREMNQLGKVCDLYERAVKADPSNEELHTHLFMSYVRIGALDQQQHAAMQLFKLKSKNPYYFWAVMSVLLQATRGQGQNDPAKREVLVALCARMVERISGSGGVVNASWGEQELRLYLRILQLQGKHQEALTLLDSQHCRNALMPGEAQLATLPLLALTQNWILLNKTAKKLIWENPDRWDFYKFYLDSAFHLMRGSGDQPEDSDSDHELVLKVDSDPIKCRDFLMKVMEKTGVKIRGPYLARLELFKRLKEHQMDPEGVLGSPLHLLIAYLEQFGSRPCCVSDLRMFLCLQPKDARATLAQAFRRTTGVGEEVDLAELPEETLQRHISAFQLCRMCGHPPSVEELLRALRSPRAVAPAIAQRAPSDPYCLLLAHHLLQSALHREYSSQPLLRALDVLEDALLRSPSNFHCKLLSLRIYHLLGCGWGAQQVYSSLEVKNVQLDSLGHVHTSLVLSTGLLLLARDHYEQALKFFINSYKDSVDHLTLSYKFGSFNKLEELMDWRERLRSSLHNTACCIERHMLDLHTIQHSSNTSVVASIPEFIPPDWSKQRDNRDVNVYVEWEPAKEEELDEVQTDFQRDLWYCRVKGSVVWCVGADVSTLQEGLDKLEDWVREASKYVVATKHDQPRMSRLNTLLPLVPTYIQAFKCLISVEAGSETDVEACCQRLRAEQDRVTKALKEQASHHDTLWTYRNTMDQLVSYVEVLSVVCVVCGRCVEARSNKSGKSKWRPPQLVATLLQQLLSALSSWPAPTPSLAHSTESLSVSWEHFPRQPTWALMAEHHTKAVANLQQVIKDKLKYMSAISQHH